MRNEKRNAAVKALGIVCALVLLVSALYVPMAVIAAPAMSVEEDVATVFDPARTATLAQNSSEYAKTGLSFYGWGIINGTAKDDSSNAVYVATREYQQTWATAGAFRLNQNVNGEAQAYNLEPNTTYVVSLKTRVLSSSVFTDEAKTKWECYVSLGYGALYNTGDENYCSNIDRELVRIVSTNAGSGAYTVNTGAGIKELECGKDWQTVTYQFTTPADLGSYDHALALFSTSRTGFRAEVDDISVIKLGKDSNVVVMVDDYSTEATVQVGKKGETVTLPDISDRANSEDHIFEGWYADEARTEKIESVTIGDEKVVVYSNWKAPVKITFKDERNEDIVISGIAGEKFEYPEDPIDENGEYWFMGWYTTQAYTELHETGVFAYSDIELYAKWEKDVPGLVQDFEDYSKDKYNEETAISDQGVEFKRKSNRLVFGNAMSKQSEVTYGESNFAIKFAWDKTMKKDTSTEEGVNKDDVNAYDAASRYNQLDHYIYLGKGIENNRSYTATFKYKVEKADTAVQFYFESATDDNAWANTAKMYAGASFTPTVSDEWQEGQIRFTTDFVNATSTTMYFGLVLSNNEDVVIYFDDISIQATTQPYESIVTVVTNTGEENIEIKGKRFEKIEFPVLTHPKGAGFIDYYMDEAFKIPCKIDTFQRKNITVYARWKKLPITFNNDYIYTTTDTLRFGRLLSIVNEKGIGYDDDYAIRWRFVGNELHVNGDTIATRGPQLDHVFTVYTGLEQGAVYHVSYRYKATTNTRITISTVSANEKNIWDKDVINKNAAVMQYINPGETDWTYVDFYFSANIFVNEKGVKGDALYIMLNTLDINTDNVAYVTIDDVLVENITAPYVFFEANNDESVSLAQGKAGETIKLPPNPTKHAYNFAGWYADMDCTVPFTTKTFEEGMELTVYAKWTPKDEETYSFEKYDIFGSLMINDPVVLETKNAKSGKQALYFDRTKPFNQGSSFAAVAQGTALFDMVRGNKYVVSMSYMVEEAPSGSMKFRFVGSDSTNFWAGNNVQCTVADNVTITAAQAKQSIGKWMTMNFVIDTAAIDRTGGTFTKLYLAAIEGKDWKIWVDDITITTIPKGMSAVSIDNYGNKNIPTVLIGKPGASFANKLPAKPSISGLAFLGYYVKDNNGDLQLLTTEDMKFGDSTYSIYARFIPSTVTQSFDTDYSANAAVYDVYTLYDFDYEIYDSAADGNIKDNVTSGRYSLHRKGTTPYFENAVLLTLGTQIVEGQKYTVTFKVKMGKHLQTDGAVKIVSGRSPTYAWTTTGDYYPVVALADLTDGEWHTVSYTFNSVEAFACIQTPGYAELFIDDVVFTLAGEETPLSTPVQYTEYVPAKRDENGNLLVKDDTAVDVTGIIDVSLYAKNDSVNMVLIIAIAAGGVIVLAAIVVLIVLLAKKKKKSKA